MPHRLAHGLDPWPLWASLRDLTGGALEGERVMVAADLPLALRVVSSTVGGHRLAGALGPVAAWHDGMPFGLGAHHVRQAVRFAREHELLALPGVGAPPEGVGVFDAPRALVEAIGAPVRVFRDYRESQEIP